MKEKEYFLSLSLSISVSLSLSPCLSLYPLTNLTILGLANILMHRRNHLIIF
jgi:hypothetical protein